MTTYVFYDDFGGFGDLAGRVPAVGPVWGATAGYYAPQVSFGQASLTALDSETVGQIVGLDLSSASPDSPFTVSTGFVIPARTTITDSTEWGYAHDVSSGGVALMTRAEWDAGSWDVGDYFESRGAFGDSNGPTYEGRVRIQSDWDAEWEAYAQTIELDLRCALRNPRDGDATGPEYRESVRLQMWSPTGSFDEEVLLAAGFIPATGATVAVEMVCTPSEAGGLGVVVTLNNGTDAYRVYWDAVQNYTVDSLWTGTEENLPYFSLVVMGAFTDGTLEATCAGWSNANLFTIDLVNTWVDEDVAAVETTMGVTHFYIELAAAPADPTTSTVALGAWSGGTPYVGHTATATLQAKTAGGVNITTGGETVVFGGTGLTAGATTDVGNGTYTATITAATAGAAVVSATIGGVTVSTTMPTATVLAVPASTATVAVTGTTNYYPGRAATVTLTAPGGVGGLTVVFSTSGGTSVVTFGATTDNGNGTYTATATSVTAGTATTVTATVDGQAVTTTMPTLTVLANPTPSARAARGGALTYQGATDVAKWQAARQYALRFRTGAMGRWQRVAVVHGATVGYTTSDVNYFALYALALKGVPVKQRTDTF